MNILFDIGHPAHVHYFKNLYKILESKGHSTMFVARDKEVTIDLLKINNIDFVCRGKGATSILGKIFYLLKANLIILKTAFKFKPDIFISFASPYAAQIAWILKIPHIAFTDTEHATLGKIAFIPFTKCILTPDCFNIDLGKKHLKFNSYMELCYLHGNYFNPDKNIYELLEIQPNEKFIILRFVSWGASHDVGQNGLNLNDRLSFVSELSRYAKVFISSEEDLPENLTPYKINIPSNKLHDALAFADLFVGEGATMASECAMLGTPAIYVNTLKLGFISELENKYGLLTTFDNSQGVLEKAIEIINSDDVSYKQKKDIMLKDKIDPTAFMVWFIEQFPESVNLMRGNSTNEYL